ncbi:MAG: hypothetical protein QM676_12980 [Novosphingobium sp.]
MNFKALLLSALAVMFMVAALAIPEASACACVEPLPEVELSAIKVQAERGDFAAIERVLAEYSSVRGDKRNTAVWTRRAIQAGVPLALQYRAYEWMWQTRSAPSLREKKVFANAALAVLERGYQNRHRISTNGVPNSGQLFAEYLRRARAINAVLNDGLDPWLTRARNNDPIAAYHMANYYFWIEDDPRKRVYWETKASQLGDPTFAGDTINYDLSTAQNLRDIRKALHSPSILARSGDNWMQRRFIESLNERQTRLRSPAYANGAK